jgi:hypothetical protein
MAAELSLGEIAATFRLVDQLTPGLPPMQREISNTIKALDNAGTSLSGLSPKVSQSADYLEKMNQKWEQSAIKASLVNPKIEEQTSLLSDFSAGLIKGVLSAGVVTGLVNLGVGAVKTAEQLTTVAERTGIAASELDRLQRIGVPSKTTLDDIARAADTLGRNLAGGKDSTAEALRSVGLSIEGVMRLSPADRFEDVGRAVASIEDPAKRAAAAYKLFGDTDLAPFFAALSRAGDDTEHWSSRTIEDLNRASTAWSSFKIHLGAEVGQIVGDFVGLGSSLDGIKNSLINFAVGHQVADAFRDNAEGVAALSASLDSAAKTAQHHADVMHGLDDTFSDSKKSIEAATKAAKEFDAQQKEETKQSNEARIAAEQHAKAIQLLADKYTGKDLAKKIKDIDEAIKSAGGTSQITAFQYDQLGRSLLDMSQQGAKIPASLHPIVEHAADLSIQAKLADDGVRGLSKALKDFPTYGLTALPTFDGLIDKSKTLTSWLKDNLGPAIKELPAPPPEAVNGWQHYSDDVHRIVSGLATDVGRTLLGIQGSLAGDHQRAAKDARESYDRVSKESIETLQRAQQRVRQEYDDTTTTVKRNYDEEMAAAKDRYDTVVNDAESSEEQKQAITIWYNAERQRIQSETNAAMKTADEQLQRDLTTAAQTSHDEIATSYADMQKAIEDASHPFRDNLADIWHGIRDDFKEVTAEMLGDFIERFIKGSLLELSGHRGAYSQAFSGLFDFDGVKNAINSSGGPGTPDLSGVSSLARDLGIVGSVWSLVGGLSGTGLFGENSYSEHTIDDIDPNDPYGYQRQGLSDAEIDNMIANQNRPRMASGGLVRARPGGTAVTLAEAGDDEFVIPRSKLGGGTVVHIDARGAFFPDRLSMEAFARQIVQYLPGASNAYVSR